MNSRASLTFLLSILAVPQAGAAIQGVVLDSSRGPVPGATVALVGPLGIADQQQTSDSGRFRFTQNGGSDTRLEVSKPGFARRVMPLPEGTSESLTVELSISAQSDSIRVAGSTLDLPASEQGGSTSVITSDELRGRNEARAFDLLREIPGMILNQSGDRGGAATLFIRGGDSNFNLVQIDGVTVNSFNYGGLFDFAHVPTDFLDRIEVIRGAQSAVYGSYANSGVVNFVTRAANETPVLDLVAEGGSHDERRFAVSGSAMVHGLGVSASASRLDSNGPVANDDYRNENVFLNVQRRWRSQNLNLDGNFNSNETGAPGPYGSDPAGLYTGLDLVSRNKNNFSDYLLHYQADIAARVREELFGSFFLNNSFYRSPYGDSFNKDIRGHLEARTAVRIAPFYTASFGVAAEREEVKNTFITDNSFRSFPLRRDQEGVYVENSFHFANRLFVTAGVRAEFFETPKIPAFADPYSPRPEIAAHRTTRVNPKVAAAWRLFPATRVHASFGTGIRPPGGFDLAFTDNPALKPERTTSFDVGVDQRLFGDHLLFGATYFHNRFSDLIVSLGGNLARLSSFRTDNLAAAQAQGAEFVAQARPARWLSLNGSYTFLQTRVLSLAGTQGLVEQYFTIGQPLARRPKHSATINSTFQYRRISANVIGYLRGADLDIEPNYGASAGFYRNPGFQNLGFNVNYAVGRGLTVYGNLRNALDQRYEEVFGYPSPLLNFVAGIKWSLHGIR